MNSGKFCCSTNGFDDAHVILTRFRLQDLLFGIFLDREPPDLCFGILCLVKFPFRLKLNYCSVEQTCFEIISVGNHCWYEDREISALRLQSCKYIYSFVQSFFSHFIVELMWSISFPDFSLLAWSEVSLDTFLSAAPNLVVLWAFFLCGIFASLMF